MKRMVELSVYMQDMHSSEEDGSVECIYAGVCPAIMKMVGLSV